MPSIRSALPGALVVLALIPAAASAQATRTWVSGVGDDVNPCSRTAPCKTFSGSFSKTADNGIINVLDPGGFGTVNVTKGVTIDGTGTTAAITASGVPAGITVNAPGKDVTLRNLIIDGTGVTCGTNGINLVDARSLRLEGVELKSFSGSGIRIAPATGGTSVFVKDTGISSAGCAGTIGINAIPSGAFEVKAMLDGVSISRWATGLSVGDGGRAYLTGTTVFDNGFGLATSGTGVIQNLTGNTIYGNGDADVPADAGMGAQGAKGDAGVKGDTGAAGTNGANGANGAPGAAGPAGAKGAAGAAAKLGKVSCKLKKKKRITCKVKAAKSVSLRLTRHGRTIAAGRGTRTISLRGTHRVHAGSYRLHLRVGGQTASRKVRL